MSKSRDTVENLRTVLVAGDVTNANFTGADLDIAKGGTGASSAGAARTALGLAIGTDVLAYDATILVDGDIGTTVLAPNGSGANLTGIETSSTLGTLTKSFLANESSEITLSSTVSPTPAVGVTKEVAQVGVSSKGSWDVVSTGDNYDLQNTATAVTLTPSSATANGTFSLGSGSFAAADVGKKITGNSGEAILTSTAGAYSIVTSFANTNAIASGSWQMYALNFDSANGITLSSLNVGFDISVASYDSINRASIALVSGIFFRPDGLRMYEIGFNAQTIYQRNMTTAWDLSTLSGNVASLDVSSNNSSPQGIFFSSDGTKAYMMGKASTSAVHQYALSTAWDVSTGSHSNSHNTSGQTTSGTDVSFSSDGLQMFIVGEGSRSIHQYVLSTAWQTSTATYTNKVYNLTAQANTNPLGLYLTPDGTRIFVVMENDIIYSYTMSTANDLATISYDSKSFNANSILSAPSTIFFKPDGSKMFLSGTNSNNYWQFSTQSVFAPTAKYHPAISNNGGQIDSTYWTDINTMTTDQINGNGTVSYAVSTDNHTTWKIAKNGVGIRSIAKNNSGTWQYNSNGTYGSETWTNGTTNTELDTIYQALNTTAANVMLEAQLEAVTDPNHFALGTTLDLMIAPYMATASASLPSSDGVSINYDAAALNKGAILGTDYDYDFPANNKVRITSLASQNLKVRVV